MRFSETMQIAFEKIGEEIENAAEEFADVFDGVEYPEELSAVNSLAENVISKMTDIRDLIVQYGTRIRDKKV